MRDFLSSLGTLAVDIGGGWISRYDCGSFKPGDVVRADEFAGSAQRVSLNGGYLCDVSLAIGDGRFFAKVERLEPETPPPAPPERGDEATELLPFAIRVGLIEVEVKALSGIGRLSYVDLGKPFGGAEDAELIVAGIALAAGKVVCVGERFGMRIARRLAESFVEKDMRTTGAVIDSALSAEPIKDYDFRMPDCFTRRGILKAQDIHREFLRTLQSRLPSTAGFRMALVDQLAYREWAEAEPVGGRRYALLGTMPARTRAEDRATLPSKLLVRPASAKEALDPSIVESLRAYAQRSLRPIGLRPIIASLGGPALDLLEEDPGLALTAACLRNGWKSVADLRVAAAAGSSGNLPGDEAAYADEMILLVRIESASGGVLDLVYPLRSLEPCFTALNA
jgi:hypothetical protein